MIHVLDYDDKIIDFISSNDEALVRAIQRRNINDNSETLELVIASDRAENFKKRNRVIIQDSNKMHREFIIEHAQDSFDGYSEIECTASYLIDITHAKPYRPGSLEKMTTSQALYEVLKDTGWQVSEQTEYDGSRTTSWTSYQTRYEVLKQLRTTYKMELDFYIELSANSISGRYVILRKKNSLFRGKEIAKGKDLTELKRKVDMSGVKTGLLAIGPQRDDGSRIEVVVTDDEAQEQFGLPSRYIWGIYEPESEDQNMTEKRLRTLATTELNKRKMATISYDITALNLKDIYAHEAVMIGDTVRVKDLEFNPPLYVEAEVIAEEYDMISRDSVYTFGQSKEFKETELREEFNKRLDVIQRKLADNISNINTIVEDKLITELQHFEKKIIKSDSAPENPVNDMLWYDTSNSDVAVLRRYWNGEWLEETASNVERIGGITREKALFSELNNTFINLNIQHTSLQSNIYELLNNEYLVNDDIKESVNNSFDETVSTFNSIKTNLDSMTPATATIGKLVDTQALFLRYREQLQRLYRAIENAKIAIDKRFKLLQSQYTNDKFNEAMEQIAATLPNGRWDSESKQLLSDIPSNEELTQLRNILSQYMKGEINSLKEVVGEETDSKINVAKNELSASIRNVKRDIENLNIGGTNLLRSYHDELSGQVNPIITTTQLFDFKGWARNLYSSDYIKEKLIPGVEYTISYDIEIIELSEQTIHSQGIGLILYDRNSNDFAMRNRLIMPREIGYKKRMTQTFTAKSGMYSLIAYSNLLMFENNTRDYDKIRISNLKLERGNVSTDWSPAPEDIQIKIEYAQQQAAEAAKVYTDSQNELKMIEAKAYADGVVDETEQKAISNAIEKMNEAKSYAEQKAREAQNLAIADADKKFNPIRTRVITAESNIQALEDGLRLTATRQDVKQTLDKELQPLKNEVNIQKAKLQVLPIQISSKVSKSDYNKDKNNIITRLNNADSERLQLSNQISDKVTLNDYSKDKESTELQLSTLQTQINQNGTDINAKATKEEFNSSKETLSRIISDLTINTTTGITLSYDDNGAITSHSVDKNGIKIRGDNVDIKLNKEFKVLIDNVNNKVGKNEVINSLNLSNEGLDINVNNLGIRGGNDNKYLSINNNEIRQRGQYDRMWLGERLTYDVTTTLKEGYLRFGDETRQRALNISAFGISTYLDGNGDWAGGVGSSGTITWWDPTYSPSNANGITVHSHGGVVALASNKNRVVVDAFASANIESKEAPIYIWPHTQTRPGLNRFAFTLSNADNAHDTNGYIMFGSDENYKYGAGLRFSKRRNRGLVEVVDGDYSSGGDTTIEAGYGKFNEVKRRDGNSYVRIQSYDLLAVGSDKAGDRVASNSIYKRTYSAPANLHITSAGTIGRATSAMKYKLAIEDQFKDKIDQLNHSIKILDLPIRTWFDKKESEIYAEELTSNSKLTDDNFILNRHTGLIAEEVEQLGLKEFVIYDDKGEIEGIAYDRLWVHLIPIIKNQQIKIEKMEVKINERK